MNNSFGIPAHLFSVCQANDTWSMTLATYASQFIKEMEKRYGSRDRSWTYVGFEFREGSPHIWFPGSHESPPPENILPSA